jgi:ATP-dependent DNA helicase RecQ
MDLPKNIESYYQETGRAGRDGLQSEALLFFSWGDVIKLKGFAEVDGNREQSEIMLKKLEIMGRFGELRTCRRKFLLNYFSEETVEECGNCDNCNTTFEKFDGTVIAQKALSAVYRTGERFGMGYVIDFLRGSQAKTIRDEHKSLKTYGVGSDISRDNWFDYFKDLISQGYIAQTEGQYPVIILTEKSHEVLKGNKQVELIEVRVKDEKKPRFVSDLTYEQALLDELKRTRASLAKRENVPPYIIFSDATLTEMAAYLPLDIAAMRLISGVGDLKLQKYGTEFLFDVRNYCKRKQLKTRIDQKRRGVRERKTRTKRDALGEDTYSVTLRMFRAGSSIDQIAAARALTRSTIEGHLAHFIPSGRVKLDELVPIYKIEPIRNAIIELNAETGIGKVKQLLGDDYSYGEIRAVAAEFLQNK